MTLCRRAQRRSFSEKLGQVDIKTHVFFFFSTSIKYNVPSQLARNFYPKYSISFVVKTVYYKNMVGFSVFLRVRVNDQHLVHTHLGENVTIID